MRGRKARGAVVVLTAAVFALLALSQVAFATASTSFTVNEVNKAGQTVQIGTWSYDAPNQMFTGAPFVQALTSTGSQGEALGYVTFSGQDSNYATTKLAVATKGFYIDDLAAWVAAQNGIPLGGATQFNVICQVTAPSFYWSTPMTLSGVDSGRYWYPSYTYTYADSSGTPSATRDADTPVARKALLAIVAYNTRRSDSIVSPAPTSYASLMTALGNLTGSADDSNSLTFFMGQLPNNYTETNLGSLAAHYVNALTFMPDYLSITPVVTGGGGTATVTTDDGYLKAAAGEQVAFTVGDVKSGYEVDSVTVTDANDKSVNVSPPSSASYTFTMPSSNATIYVKLVSTTKIDLSGASIAAIPAHAYTGSAITPTLKVTYGGVALVADTDYTVAYSDNTALGVGTATITGIGSCTGTNVATFLIVPCKVRLLMVKAGDGTATVSWKKSAGGVSGYQVTYRKKSSSKFVSAGTTRKLSKVVRDLSHGKSYTFRVCAYKVIDGASHSGSWSSTKTVTVK